jgi:hypothetical protein
MTKSLVEPMSRRFSPELVAVVVLVVAYVGWLLSLPAFPTQDGPIHLYYTHVLRALFAHRPTPYSDFYRVKHLLPPYSLYYYALLGLAQVVSLLVADRLIVCGYVVSFVFGFRYLARALGPAADTMTLIATLLLLNWPLGMGFVNFCLALSFAFWAIGLWLRFAGRTGLLSRIAFVLLAVLVMFTHPLPLLAVLGVAGLELMLRVIANRRAIRSTPQLVRDMVTWIAAACTLGYVKLFTASHPLQQTSVDQESGSFAVRFAHNVANYASEKGVAFLLGPGLALRTYRLILLVAIAVPLFLAIRQFVLHRRSGKWTAADVTLVLAIAAMVLMPFVPHDLNGSHFFAERLLLVFWLLPLFAASGSTLPRRGLRTAILSFVLVAQAITLSLANAKMRPVANAIAAVDLAPNQIAAAPGAVGLVLDDARRMDAPPGLAFDPFLWAAVDVLRHDNAVLANTPWLDLEIIPLGGTARFPGKDLGPGSLEFPSILRAKLKENLAARKQLLSAVDFVVVEQAYRPPATGPDPLLQDDAAPWGCRTAEPDWLRICSRQVPRPANQIAAHP